MPTTVQDTTVAELVSVLNRWIHGLTRTWADQQEHDEIAGSHPQFDELFEQPLMKLRLGIIASVSKSKDREIQVFWSHARSALPSAMIEMLSAADLADESRRMMFQHLIDDLRNHAVLTDDNIEEVVNWNHLRLGDRRSDGSLPLSTLV